MRDEDQSFLLVHREIHESGTQGKRTSLVFPPEFAAQATGTDAEAIASAAGYEFQDTTYRLALTDRTLGLHRREVSLCDEGGRQIMATPVVWQRLPFLSTTPNRLCLSSRPVRTFLNCPDESVEVVSIVSAPKGVKAVLASPREVIVTPTTDAPELMDGLIELRTTAQGQGPLKIPVVRYAPLAKGS